MQGSCEATYEVREGCVLPLELLKIQVEACSNSLEAKDVEELPEKRRAFAIRDAIEERVGLFGIIDFAANRMRRGQLV